MNGGKTKRAFGDDNLPQRYGLAAEGSATGRTFGVAAAGQAWGCAVHAKSRARKNADRNPNQSDSHGLVFAGALEFDSDGMRPMPAGGKNSGAAARGGLSVASDAVKSVPVTGIEGAP